MKIRTLILSILLFFTSMPLIVFYVFVQQHEEKAILASSTAKLKDVADIQHERIKSYLVHHKSVTDLIKSRTQLRQLVSRENIQLGAQSYDKLTKIIQDATGANDDILGISVYTIDQNLLYSNFELLEDTSWLNSFQDDKSQFNVALVEGENEKYVIFTDKLELNATLIGYIAVAFSDKRLTSIVSDYTGLEDTGETVLANRQLNGDALFLTPTRHDPSVALNLTVPKQNLEIPITHAMNGIDDIFPNYVDYRDIPVLAVSRHIPEADWGMVVKIDQEEIFRNLESLKLQSLYILASMLAVVFCLYILFVNWAVTPFITLQNALTAAAKGDKAEIKQHSKILEIQEVTVAFNQMVNELQQSEAYLHDSISELTELNSRLDSEAERFKRWKESNFIGILHSDAEGHIIDANTTILDMIGYTREELENNEIDWKKLTPKEYLHLDIKAVEEANEKGYWTPFEKVYIHKDGHEVPILIGGSIFNRTNQEFIVFIVNLSEKYEQTRELEQYKGIIENSKDMFAFVDLEYRFRTVNQAYLNLHGLQREQVIGEKVPSIVGKSFFEERLKSNIDRALSGTPVTFIEDTSERFSSVDTLKVTYVPYRSEEGKIIGFIFEGEDISELRAKQKTIELKEAEQKRIIESMLEGIFTVNEQGIVLSFNPEAENIFGYSEHEIIGQSVDVLTDNVKHHDKKISNYLTTGQSSIINNRLGRDINAKRKDGTIFPIRIAVASMPLAEDGAQHFIANFQDMSEQEKQSKLLNRRLKLESLGNVAGGVAHDVNNILGIILGYNDLLSAGIKDKESCLEAIENACARGQKLTRDLLTFAKKNNKAAVNVDINQLVLKNRALLETAMTSKITLELALGEHSELVQLEENLFEDMLLNLAINAMHAMPQGGRLEIATKSEQLTAQQAEILGLQEGNYVVLMFSDEGEGIHQDVVDKIFDPFFTTKEDFGSGLGLSQCYGFVKANGGHIDVQSEVGKGTTFSIYLPVSDAIKIGSTDIDKTASIKLPSGLKNCLLVDDEKDICFVIKSFLEQEGLTVFDCNDPNEAFEILHSNKIDFVVSDVIMPEMSGTEFIATIKKASFDLPHLFVSGYINPEQSENIKDLQILYKPFTREQLLQRINEVYEDFHA